MRIVIRAVIDTFPFRHIGSKLCDMLIHYRQYTDTFSSLNYLQNHCCGEKNVQKLVLYYLENSKLSTKSSFVEKKTVKLVLYYPGNHRKDPSWLAMCNVYFRNELPTGLPVRLCHSA